MMGMSRVVDDQGAMLASCLWALIRSMTLLVGWRRLTGHCRSRGGWGRVASAENLGGLVLGCCARVGGRECEWEGPRSLGPDQVTPTGKEISVTERDREWLCDTTCGSLGVEKRRVRARCCSGKCS